MNENDYILLFDQNGSPYISHASLSGMRQRATGALKSVGSAAMNAAGTAKQGVGRGVRTTHKYIQKIEENGRARYFYTQEELKAYYNEKKAAAQQTFNKAKEKARTAVGESQDKAAQARTRADQISKEFQNKPASKNMAEPQLYFSSNHVSPSPTPPKKVYTKDLKGKMEKAKDAIKDTTNKVTDTVKNKLKEHNGSPSNSDGETRSMLGSYAVNIPSEPKKLKEWADGGKQQAQQVLNEAEQEFKKLEQDFKNGKITQQQMWMAQGIMEGLRDEMSEWEYLSDMNADQLSDLFGPLLKKK